MTDYCESCERKTEVKCYIQRDIITDNYVGAVNICKDCLASYEELNAVTLSIE